MKIFLKYILIVLVSFLTAVSCRDEEAVRFPELQNGVNARVAVHPDNAVLNFLDIDNASLVFDVYSENKDLEELVYTVTFADASLPSKKFPTVEAVTIPASAFVNGKASAIQLTAVQLAEALGLPGGGAYLGGGDNFTFFATAKLKDGRIINAASSNPNITTGAKASFTTQFKLFVSCPFLIDEAIGSYTLTTDPAGWGTTADHQLEIIAGPGTNQVTLKDALGYPQKFDMIVSVDPGTGIATVAKQKTFDYDFWDPAAGYGVGSTAGTGFFFSCSGLLTLDLGFTVDAGSFGSYKLEYTKN